MPIDFFNPLIFDVIDRVDLPQTDSAKVHTVKKVIFVILYFLMAIIMPFLLIVLIGLIILFFVGKLKNVSQPRRE